MNADESLARSFMQAIQEALDYGGEIPATDLVGAFDSASAHVVRLLTDASLLYGAGSFGTSAFLCITAIEETAKAELIRFRTQSAEPAKPSTKRRDPLRDHKLKQRAAVRTTTFMGRLVESLGPAVCSRLAREAHDGTLLRERERALYVHVGHDGILSPAEMIDEGRARELLLLACECADDVLVGYTNLSYDHGRKFEEIIATHG